MRPDVIALFREVADCSPKERAVYYQRHRVPPSLSAEVESLLGFDRDTVDRRRDVVAAAADLLRDRTGEPGAARPGLALDAVRPELASGSMFGPYRIVAPVGRGGMGVVYAAEEVDSGRRVALKVLAAASHDVRERERFEREGRLAASVNHRHCVFVFTATEIEGLPVIAMEMMRETLADRLSREGPLPPAPAVDAILQVISGLREAGAHGILHRDVKPANCFVDAYGVVKIGDFGISRSQRPIEDTELPTQGQCHATPAYASPEQLRGVTLDVRADIYSVCATLYELLTGRRVFAAPDLMALLMAVANDTPIAPHVIVSAVPKGLSAIVLRGLMKRREQRFADYEVLATALAPYASTAPTAATLGRRCLAGAIDWAPLLLISLPIGLLWGRDWYSVLPLVTSSVAEMLYFGLSERFWAATPGKALCGLTVVQKGGAPASGRQCAIRAITYVLIPTLPLLMLTLASESLAKSQLLVQAIGHVQLPMPQKTGRIVASADALYIQISAASAVVLLLMFAPARKRNGFAAIHDLVSQTRVVDRRAEKHESLSPSALPRAEVDVERRLGPFAVLREPVSGMGEGWRLAIDQQLRRRVWIREAEPDRLAVSPARRSIDRSTRLRWLAGRREERQAWDAFESVDGVPLERAILQSRHWRDVRVWLRDLARECRAQRAGDRPPRRLDRVWILDAGGAKLVDDPAHDGARGVTVENYPTAAFLADVARAARESAGQSPPWPLHAHQFLERLQAEPSMDEASIEETIESLMQRPPAVTVAWRLTTIAVPLLLPLLWAATTLFQLSLGTRISGAPPGASGVTVQILQALLVGLFFVAVPALVAAVATRGGLMRILGLDLVTADGCPASRARVALRTVLAWSPFWIATCVAIWPFRPASHVIISIGSASLLILLAGAFVALMNPSRGIQDRLAGTFIVPR
jgi:eukaryotic-like serine/threonine-protein kinase